VGEETVVVAATLPVVVVQRRSLLLPPSVAGVAGRICKKWSVRSVAVVFAKVVGTIGRGRYCGWSLIE